MFQTKPHLSTDFYKVAHVMDIKHESALHPIGISQVYEVLTPRNNSYFPYDDKMVVFGYEVFAQQLRESWSRDFFDQPWLQIASDFEVFLTMADKAVYDSVITKFKALHNLGYLPIHMKALPEGTLVPMRVPVLSITNTHPDFYWLPGYLETTLLSTTFVTSTVASVARQFRKIAEHYARASADSNAYIDWQFHDFSQRGQHGDEASILSGLGHLTSFKGSDAVPAVAFASQYMRQASDTERTEVLGGSVVATEHSIMETLAGEYGTDLNGQHKAWESLIARNPSGILSVVADTYDYWQVIDDVMPLLKDAILARDGKLVIRPDSISEVREMTDEAIPDVETQLVKTLESLYDTFGGHVNTKGFKVLNEHIGVLHGEGVTLENISTMFDAILDAGFSAENIVFGVGAYVYSVKVSRDDFAQALKATACVTNGVERQVFKQPKSEAESFKRSPKGFVTIHGASANYTLVEGLSSKEAADDQDDQLRTIFLDRSADIVLTSLPEIREQILTDIDL